MGTGSKVVAGAFALLLVSGCGAIADKAGEKIGEKVAESATGCENIDVSDKGVSAECDGNSVSVDSDGNVTSSDEDGNSGSFETGSELPEDWPAELDPPDGTKVLVSSTNTVNGKRSWFAVAAVPGEVADLASGLRDQLTDAGFTIENESTSSAGGTDVATISASSDSYQANIVISDTVARAGGDIPDGSTGVSFTIAETEG